MNFHQLMSYDLLASRGRATHYEVIQSHDLHTLVEAVEFMMKEGWEPLGKISEVNGFFQSIIKK